MVQYNITSFLFLLLPLMLLRRNPLLFWVHWRHHTKEHTIFNLIILAAKEFNWKKQKEKQNKNAKAPSSRRFISTRSAIRWKKKQRRNAHNRLLYFSCQKKANSIRRKLWKPVTDFWKMNERIFLWFPNGKRTMRASNIKASKRNNTERERKKPTLNLIFTQAKRNVKINKSQNYPKNDANVIWSHFY